MTRCIIIVPCYNEAARLNVEVFRQFSHQEHSVGFIFVNDGSTDGTLNVLKPLCDSNAENLNYLDVPHGGKAEAVRQGLIQAFKAHSDYVGFWDADLATPLSPILDFCKILDQNPHLQMVIGARVKLLGREIERQMIRHYLGRLYATAVSMMLRLPIYDTQCGAKIFRVSPEICVLFEHPFKTTWTFDVEIIARMRQRKTIQAEEVIYEFPLTKWSDVRGSKVKPLDFGKAFFELIKIYFSYLRPGVPKPITNAYSQPA